MQNAKYIAFYALLLIAIVLGAMSKISWLIIFPYALLLAGAFIFVKGKDWRKMMGNSEMNPVVVFVATYISQIVLCVIFFGVGRLVGMIF